VFRFRKLVCPPAEKRLRSSFVVQNGKNTRADWREGDLADPPSCWRHPIQDAANSRVRLAGAFFRRFETQVAGPAIIWHPKQRKSARRPRYCPESQADAKRCLESELVKATNAFPVKIEIVNPGFAIFHQYRHSTSNWLAIHRGRHSTKQDATCKDR
jgi:hypothetical protein